MHHYRHLAIMAGLHFAAMFLLMYAMVDRVDNVFANVNQAYMAALMTSPMVLIELAVMRSMYRDRRLNAAIAIAGAIVLLGAWALIRTQGAVGDRQFLRSMIPHHASALLMCNEAAITDAAIQRLCGQILESQEREIRQMKEMLARPG